MDTGRFTGKLRTKVKLVIPRIAHLERQLQEICSSKAGHLMRAPRVHQDLLSVPLKSHHPFPFLSRGNLHRHIPNFTITLIKIEIPLLFQGYLLQNHLLRGSAREFVKKFQWYFNVVICYMETASDHETHQLHLIFTSNQNQLHRNSQLSMCKVTA